MKKKDTTLAFLEYLELHGHHLLTLDINRHQPRSEGTWVILSDEFDNLWEDFKRDQHADNHETQ